MKNTKFILLIFVVLGLFYFEQSVLSKEIKSPILKQVFEQEQGLFFKNIYSGFPAYFTNYSISFKFVKYIFNNFFFSLFFASVGFFTLLIFLKINRFIAFIFSLVYIFQPKILYFLFLNKFTDLTFYLFLPWIIFSFLLLKRNRNTLSFALLTLFMTMSLMVGSIESNFITILFFFVYIAIETFATLIKGRYFKLLQFLIFSFFALIISVLASIENILLLNEFVKNFLYTSSFQPTTEFKNFLNLILPFNPFYSAKISPFNSMFLFYFVGFGIVLLAIIGVYKNFRGYQKIKLAVLGIIFFLLSNQFINIKFLIPCNQLINNPNYFLLVFNLILLLFGAFGVKNLFNLLKGKSRIKFVPFILLILITFIFYFTVLKETSSTMLNIFYTKILFMQLICLLLIFTPIFFKKYKKVQFYILLTLSLLPILFIIKMQSYDFVSPRPKREMNMIERVLRNDQDIFRIFPLEHMFQDNKWALYNQTIGGFNPIILKNYNYLLSNALETNVSNNIPINWNVIDMLNVKYLIRQNEPIKLENLEYIDYDRYEYLTLYKNLNFIPRAWFVENLLILRNQKNILKKINSVDFSPKKMAILSERVNKDISTSSKQSIKFLQSDEIKISTDTSTFLVLSEIYYPKKIRAFLNGKDWKIYPVNLILMGFYIPKGEHLLTITFDEDFGTIIKLISFGGLLLNFLSILFGTYLYFKNLYSAKTIYILKDSEKRKRVFI